MSIKNVTRAVWKNDKLYLNPDPSEDISIGSFGTLRSRMYQEEGEIEDYFDDFDVTLPAIETQGEGAGRTFFSSSFVEGSLKITGNLGNTSTMTAATDRVSYGSDNFKKFSGKMTLNFSRRNSYFLSYSNFTHFQMQVNSEFGNKVEEIYNAPGRDWKKSFVLVTGRTIAENCTMIYANSRRTNVTFSVDVTTSQNTTLSVGQQMSLGDSQNMGITINGMISGGRDSVTTLEDDVDSVPFLEFHKLKGTGRNLTLRNVR